MDFCLHDDQVKDIQIRGCPYHSEAYGHHQQDNNGSNGE
ncbi:hypothetical protein CWATWH0402_4021 [Crocosphaera watsonii WH 0402]|uniref:Uncharacterized protein n=1 Tax=Crocosphaera watsonii WH 0402 TaxID=1284629 RepID=T2JK87_CROWT|nr:hypothetical protein CWATWH0402_4021 [Crocosphaera watsonii WH 0402]